MAHDHDIIAADIGNTGISLCRMRGLKILVTLDLPSHAGEAGIRRALKNDPDFPVSLPLVIASVNPPALKDLSAVWAEFGGKVWTLGVDLQATIENLTAKPDQAGQDRLMNALAARRRAGNDVIVVDFGTAITFDIVRDGAYVGGAIAPGIGLAMEALHKRTALLPLVEITRFQPPAIGRDTESAIRAGVYYGYLGLVSRILDEVLKEYPSQPKVLATGGYGAHLAPEIKGIDMVVPELTHEGIALAWAANQA